jgi:drug/metabolite transporter (DMT)-like permease
MPQGIASPPATAAAGVPADPLALAAFAGATLFAGGNAVAIRLGYAELAPYWGAALRFLAAALILLVAAALLGRTWPRGRALAGVLAYGVLNFGLNYMLAYFALREVTAGTAMVVLAIVPLLTLVLAAAQGAERFRVQGLVGALTAAVGIALVFRAGLGTASVWAMLALLGGALCIAESNIVIKIFPRVDPVMESAIAMAVGGLWLLAASLLFAEPWVVPTDPAVRWSLLYLVTLGSIGLFVLYLVVLARWTATAASYILLISPLVAILLGALMLGEPVGPEFLAGGALVLAGVYVGAFLRRAPGQPG